VRESSASLPQKVSLGQTFSLPFQGQFTLEGEDFLILWEKPAQDSRCPADVVCVWAGEVNLELELRLGSKKEILALKLPPKNEEGLAFLEGRYRLFLLEVQPYPGKGNTEPPSLKLKIEKSK